MIKSKSMIKNIMIETLKQTFKIIYNISSIKTPFQIINKTTSV